VNLFNPQVFIDNTFHDFPELRAIVFQICVFPVLSSP
jgi:hypothetical protein